jgi:hypothetical protein
MKFDKRLKKMANTLHEFQNELDLLERIIDINDIHALLNKVRYITEGILLESCKKHSISWGKGDPRMDRMLGPLRAAKVLPAPVYVHFRTIQNLTNPGSHFQEQQMNESHTEIAQLALIEVLEWYASEEQLQDLNTVDETVKGRTLPKWFFVLLLGLFFAFGVTLLLRSLNPKFTQHKRERAPSVLEQYSLNISERHFKMIQISQIFAKQGNEARIQEEWKRYRTIVESYNTKRGVYRTDLQYIFGEEMFMWEREIHLQLLYAGRNLECLYNGKGDKSTLLQNVTQQLNTVNAEYQEYKMTANQLIDGERSYPLEVTRKKTEVDQSLANPCQ